MNSYRGEAVRKSAAGKEAVRKKTIRREILHHRTLIVSVGLILAIFLILVGGSRVHANQAQASGAYETATVYTSVYVNPGDTLWDIAERYMGGSSVDHKACVDELRRINHMNAEEDLLAGAYILVPCSDPGI